MKVYLCGPINGCTDAECKDWRNEAFHIARMVESIDEMDVVHKAAVLRIAETAVDALRARSTHKGESHV